MNLAERCCCIIYNVDDDIKWGPKSKRNLRLWVKDESPRVHTTANKCEHCRERKIDFESGCKTKSSYIFIC